MKNKLIFGSLILLIVVSILGINMVYADTEVAKIEANLSSKTIAKGEELTITVSATQINEGIAGMSFTLNYDSTLFDFVSKTDGDDWTSTKVENSYAILTKTYVATTKTGNIISIKLKAKDTIILDKETTIKLEGVELSKDDASTVQIADITKNVTIKLSNNNEETNTNTVTNTITNTVTNTVTNSIIVVPSTNTVTNTVTNTQSGSATNQTKVNTTQGESSNKENISTDSKMPQTGEEDYIIIAGIVIVAIVGSISYILYRKNNL